MPSDERRLSISEAAKELEVPAHVLRRWEERFPHLKPGRDRANRRFYVKSDIESLRRVKQLLRHELLTSAGARKRIAQEVYGEGRPRTRREVVDMLDAMEAEIRGLLELLGPDLPPR